MQEELSILVQAQYPLIYLVTSEEDRAEQAVMALARSGQPARRIFSWTLTRGLVEHNDSASTTQQGTIPPQQALDFAIRQREPAIFLFKDLHPFLDGSGNPEVIRWLRDAIAQFRGTEKVIVLMSPVQQVPIELEKEVVVLDFALPNMGELNQVLSNQLLKSRSLKLAAEGARNCSRRPWV